ncbi:hypothetical protein BHE74_00038379 [Ensete ventricosum]|nr:hypothetical protein BHE74_00038379 [Ensete ventricosum]
MTTACTPDLGIGIAHSSSSGLGSNYLVSCSYLQRIERNGKDDGEEMHLNRDRPDPVSSTAMGNARDALLRTIPPLDVLWGKRRKLLRRLRRRDPFRRRGGETRWDTLSCARRKVPG